MKLRFLLFVCAISCICFNSYGQQVGAPTGRDTVYLGVFSEQLGIDILEQLKVIKEIQDSTYQQRMRAIEAREKDSHSPEAGQSEFGVMSEVEKNTRFNFFSNDFNAMGILAFIVACLSLWVAKITYDAQKRTEENTQKTEKQTQNAPLSVQKSKLQDLARHFYRNLVCTCAAIFKFKEKSNRQPPYDKPKKYPSESNILKLQVLPDDIVMPIDIAEESYKEMHELRLLFRNYNVEVNVASKHLSRYDISDESLVQDFDNLLFKPINLSVKTFKYEKALYDDGITGQASRNIIAMIKEHFSKLMEAGNFGILLIPENHQSVRTLVQDNCAFIRKQLDQKNGIGRSLMALLEEGYKDQEPMIESILTGDNTDNAMNEFISSTAVYYSQYETTSPRSHSSQKRYVASVNRKIFLDNLDNKDLRNFISALTNLARSIRNENEDSLSPLSFYDYYYGGKIHDERATVDPHWAFMPLEPYLEFINQDSWDFETLLRYMLAVDIAIETDRIGMVNYAN